MGQFMNLRSLSKVGVGTGFFFFFFLILATFLEIYSWWDGMGREEAPPNFGPRGGVCLVAVGSYALCPAEERRRNPR
jgi:hypothetical protein